MDSARPFIPFALPDLGGEEIAAVSETLASNWLTTGPKAKQFEEDVAAFLGGGIEAVAVSSATAGLHLALEAVGIGPGDEVITTPYTFTATAEVICHLGATPVFADINPRTLNIDPAGIEAAITPRTRAILPVHVGGLPCEMGAILDIARRHRLRVVEDAAHALPATHGGRLVGTLASDATVFSFYATKTVTAGEGGMVVTRQPPLAARCRTMRLHGIDRDVFDRHTSRRPAWRYEVVAPGFKYNLPDLAAAIGIPQLRKARRLQERRQQIALYFRERLRLLAADLPSLPPAGDLHAWHLFPLRLRAEARIGRDLFIEKMAEAGVGCSVHFIPLHLHPYWRQTYHLDESHYPHATREYSREVSLPLYSRMSDDEVEHVAATVCRLLS